MDTIDLLSRLRDLNVRLSVAEGRLRFSAAPGVMTDELRAELGRRKAELLSLLGGASRGSPPIRPLPRTPRTSFPLSPAQKRLFFLAQLEPWNPEYNIPGAVAMGGAVDVAAFGRALLDLCERHETLRTRFAEDGEGALQVVEPPGRERGLLVVDLTGLRPGRCGAELDRRLAAEVIRPFDLTRGRLFRTVLFRRTETSHVFFLNHHHIISDGWSVGVLIRDLMTLYGARRRGLEPSFPSLPVQYADFAVWLRGREVAEAEVEWWRRRLAGAATLDLPADRPRPAVRSGRGSVVHVLFPGRLQAELEALGRGRSATLFMIAMAGFQALLHRTTGQRDIVVGTPVAGRRLLELEGLIGCFVNTLVLRSSLGPPDGAPTWEGLLDHVREDVAEAQAHQDVPFERLVDALGVPRDRSRTPVFQVMLIQEGSGFEQVEAEGLLLRRLPLDHRTSKFDLTLYLLLQREGLGVVCEYSTDLFDATTIRRFAGHFRNVLETVAASPGTAIPEIGLLQASERQQLLHEWNDTGAGSGDGFFHRWIEAQAERTPDAEAVVFAGMALTYRELVARAGGLARHLCSLGVGPEVPVALCVDRSPEMLVALLGILRAGGAYLPLDPGHPEERLAYVLEDSGAPVLVTQERLRGLLPGYRGDVVYLDAEEARGELSPDEKALDPENLAYVLYTSGTTGRPKGVAVPHRSVANFLLSMRRRPGLGPGDRLLAVTTLSFDISVLELFLPLMVGATVVLASRDEAADARRLREILEGGGITAFQATPATWRMLVEAGWRDTAEPPLKMLCGGEALPRELAESLLERSGELWNLYGPTETTVWSSAWRFPPPGRERRGVSVGRPIRRTSIHLLDRHLRCVPAGVVGELWIGGGGLARGYLRRPDLTAERFCPNPYGAEAGERLYRTGDLARRLGDGRIEHLGRIDHQVKVRGFRIELAEIEAVLAAHDAVAAAVVTAPEDRLVAYFVPAGGASPPAAQLRDFAARKLPPYMVPTTFVELGELPLNPNGKVDRKALPAPGKGPAGPADRVLPQTEMERVLAEIWCDVLGLEEVGVDEAFFDVGGHSLLATRVVHRLEERLGLRLGVVEMFEHPTIASLARTLRPEEAAPVAAEATPLTPLPRTQPLPLSFGQERLWFLSRLEPEDTSYNVVGTARIEGRIHPGHLRESLNALAFRHETLRTRFVETDDGPVQIVDPPRPEALPTLVLDRLGAVAAERELDRLLRAERRHVFDLARGPLLRLRLVRLGELRHVLIICQHHIVTDGWSMEVMLHEIGALYRAEGRRSALPALPVQYADYAVWQRRWLEAGELDRQLAWWREEVASVPALELPTDRPRPPVFSGRGSEHRTRVDGPLLGRLTELARTRGATAFMVFLAAVEVLLSRLTGQRDFAVASPVAGRVRPELEGLIGFFVNTVVYRCVLPRRVRFSDHLAAVAKTSLAVFAHQDAPFEKVVESLVTERERGRPPLAQAMLVFQNAPFEPLEVEGLKLVRTVAAATTTKFDLLLELWPEDDGLTSRLEYATDLFDPTTAVRWHRHLLTLLEAIAARPESPVAALPLLRPEERRQLLVEWNATATSYPRDATVDELFDAQARRTPDAVALVWERRDGAVAQMSYGELSRRSERLAGLLRGHLDGSRETLMGLFLERSPEMVVAILAVLKAGAAYAPFDPGYPEARLAALVRDTATPLVLTQESLAGRLPEGTPVLLLDNVLDEAPAGAPRRRPDAGGDSLCYVMYTSGTTGRPKGVAVPHRAVVRLVCETNFAAFGPGEVFLQLAPISFDASTLELWGPLLHGGRLVLHSPGPLSLDELAAAILRHRVSTLWLTSGLFQQMVETHPEGLAEVRQLLAGGDVLSLPHVRETLARTRGRLVNGYGPTENTTFTCCYSMTGTTVLRGTVPIGRPIANTRIYLADPALEPVPMGVPGLLWTGGDGLARGYLNRPAATAAVFVPDPWSTQTGGRLYRTGDLARYRPSGDVEFLGRADRQVKIRGFRIELAEIESHLASLPGVARAAVTVHEGKDGGKRLVGYVVPEPGGEPPADLRQALAEALPSYMVPQVFLTLEKLPLDPNGKVDRRALPAPDAPASEGYVEPRTGTEKRLAEIWADLLGAERVGAVDDFFELGGHSLAATRLVTSIRKALGAEIALADVFSNPTLAAVAARIDAAGAARPDEVPLVPVPRDEPLPLSFAQQRLWFLHQLEPWSAEYNIPSATGVDGPLDIAVLRRSLDEVVRRHESLRTRFGQVDGEAVQEVDPPSRQALPVVDLAALPAGRRRREARRLGDAEAVRLFDLERGPLQRATLLRLGPEEHVFLLCQHHIVSDGWSVGVLIRELGTLYRSFARGEPSPLGELPVQYADFAVWQRRWLQGEVLERQLAYWRTALAGVAPLELPADRPRPAVRSGRGAVCGLTLPAGLSQELEKLGQGRGATLFMVLLAALQTLLSRYSGQGDVSVGTPIAGRQRPEVEGSIGFFVNTLVMRADLSGKPSFGALLEDVRRTALDAYEHQDVPFEQLVEAVYRTAGTSRDQGRTPLFQVMFAFQTAGTEALEMEEVTLCPLAVDSRTAKFDLTLNLTPRPEGPLPGWIEYSVDLFDATTVRRLARHFETLLRSVVAQGDASVARLHLLSPEERRQLLVEWNATGTAYPRDATIHDLFDAQAAQTPAAVALVWERDDGTAAEMSYGELARRSDRLTGLLGERLGVSGEIRVGLFLERSPEMVVAILGILKAGAAYVPFDTGYPEARLRALLEDAAPAVVLTDAALAGRLPAGTATLRLDADSPAASGVGRPAVTADSLGYVMYTSGTTGRPKGVAVPHRAVVRLVRETNFASFGPDDVSLLLAPASFDASTLELWGPLLNGGRLVLHPSGPLSLEALAASVTRHRVTTLWLTSGLFQQMVETYPQSLAGVRQLLAGGDVLSAAHVRRMQSFLEHPGGRLINGYGPTENTTFTCCHPMTRDAVFSASVPVGRPISNTRVYLADREMEVVPCGVPGLLYTGGDGLARGYLNRPAWTAAAFVPDPWSAEPGGRLYSTGDLARYLVGGEVEFLGRADRQVKIRGFRIELAEIEAHMNALPGVARSAVTVHVGTGGDKRLVGYLVPASGEAPPPDLHRALGAVLPPYMVPQVFRTLEELPLDANGKLDRRALPAPDAPAAAAAYVAPRTETEKALAEAWSEVLGVERIGVEDDFFELGGHSLLATRAVSRVRQSLGVELKLQQLFLTPTVAGLASAIDGTAEAGGDELPPLVATPRGAGGVALSFAQQRLWFLHQLEPQNAEYHMPMTVAVDGALDVAVLRQCLDEIVRRHEALRTRFEEVDGEAVQIVDPPRRRDLAVVDLRALPEERRSAELERCGRTEAMRLFDLRRGPLLRATLLRLAPERHVFLLNQHHIVSDGSSMTLLVGEVGALYRAFRLGEPSPLPRLPVQYADFAVWQRGWLDGEVLERQVAYWKERLAGVAPLELPADRVRPAVRSGRGGIVPLRLAGTLRNALEEVVQKDDATLFMALLAAFQTLLARLTRQRDVAVGTPIAGRRWPEAEGLIGFFVNTLVMRSAVRLRGTFSELLAEVRRSAIQAYDHQDVPFERLVEELFKSQPRRDRSRTPLFQVMLAFQSLDTGPLELPGLRLTPLLAESGSSKFDLTLSLNAIPGGAIEGSIEYSTDLFDETTVVRLGRTFETLLESVAEDRCLALRELDMIPAAERHELLGEWNAAPAVRPLRTEARGLYELFEAQAVRTPEAVALLIEEGGETRHLTYAELDRGAGRLARRLRRLGVAPEVLVGVALPRSPEMVTALLAVLKAGGAYVPLDPAYPAERVAFMLADAGARLVVSEPSLKGLFEGAECRVLHVGAEDDVPDEPLLRRGSPENLAYVIYTSGSTGRAKGVAITHRSALLLVDWAREAFPRSSLEAVLASTSICFDISIFEIFVPLAVGGRLVLVENALALPRLAARDEVTLVNTVPSAMTELVRDADLPESVEIVNLAGEPLPNRLVQRVYVRSRAAQVRNLYGPSEDTTYSTWCVVEEGLDGKPSIGRPLPGTSAYVVDDGLLPVPLGVPGELYLGGAGLARGYLARPALTAERFVPDPWSPRPGARLYRTGDLTRYLRDGRFDFLGRLDHQVKIRGFRIELGEVEAVLVSVQEVQEAVVLAREDVPGELRLVAYVVPAPAGEPAAQELRAFLSEKLPAYMVPSAFLVLGELPLLPNGKVNRAALPAPEGGDRAARFVAPRSKAEKALAAIFTDLLHVEKVGVEDDFFALGGHSLLATRVVSRLRRDFGVEIALDDLFQTPRVAELAARIETVSATASPLILARAAGPRVTSFAQERLWFLDQLDPGSAAYNIPTAVRLHGTLDPALLERSLQAVVDRHESLRTRFETADGRPVPVIAGHLDVELRPVAVDPADLPRQMAEAAAFSFDLEKGPLFDARLLRLRDDEHVFLMNLHHVIADGWSLGVLVYELADVYRAQCEGRDAALPELPIQYGDYAAWQRERMQGAELERQLGYWRERLAPPLAVLELPADRPRPAIQTYDGALHALILDAGLADALRRLARDAEASLFMVLVSAFQVLLKRWSGQEDVLVGFPIAGRRHAEVENLIGIFLNTLVLRTDFSGGEPTFRELLDHVRRDALGAFAHQDVPFEKLLAELYPERDLSRTPIFQVFFNMLNLPQSEIRLPGLMVELESEVEMPSKFDLTVYANERNDGTLLANLVYNADLFDRDRIGEMAEQYRLLLTAMVADLDAPVDAVPLTTARAAALLPNPGTPLSDAWRGPLHAGLTRRAAEHPERPAVVDKDDCWSYGELDARANQLAHHLLAQGLQPGEAVAIFAQRNASLVWALLGVLKAGGVFVILDPAYPVPRLLEYVRQSRPRALLEVAGAGEPPAEVLDVLDLRCRLALPRLRGARELLAGLPARDPDVELGPDDPVYVAFTSGSTGKPKGILGRHGSITHFLPWLAETFGFDHRDRHSLLSALSHDPLHRDVFMPLWYGATLCIPDPDQIFSPGYLARWVAEERVTILNLTPAMLRILATGSPEGDLDSLRYTFLIGDVLTRRDVAALYALSSTVTAVNFYGSTETQRSLSYHPVPREEVSPEALRREKAVLPLGRGIRDVQVLVLNGRNALAGVGELGEIYFRSHHMALGYLHDESLNRERFLTNPFTGTPGDRLYRTGDLGRYRADGGAEFAGRADRQVKVRGFRIELAEVEAALAAHPGVRECAVGTWDAPAVRLAAWVVPAASAPPVRELRSHLLGELPDYMVPAAFVFLDAMPLTRTGKLDRAALPAPEGVAAELGEGFAGAALGPEEEVLAGIWSELLGRGVDLHSDFFELGGHSLLATQLLSRLREVFGVALPVRRIFETPTVAGLAQAVREARGAAGPELPPLVPAPRPEEGVPLSSAQERLWILDRLEPGRAAYVMAGALRLRGHLLPDALEAALTEVVRRHEVLRSRFVAAGGEVSQVVAPGPRLTLAAAEVAEDLEARIAWEVRRPFDLAAGPVFRATLVRTRGDEHVLVLALHHIVADGWSVGLLAHELAVLYNAFATRTEPMGLPDLTVQYADFAVWQGRWLDGVAEAQLGYWKEALAGVPLVLELPTDRPRPAVQSYRGRLQTFDFPEELVAALRDLGLRRGATLFMTLFAGLSALLGRWSGQRGFLVGTPVAGRHRVELEPLIGLFANTLVLPADLGGDPSFADLLARTRSHALDAYAHQDLPFERLVAALAPERDLSRTPLFQVMLSLQNQRREAVELAGLTLEPLVADTGTSRFDLFLSAAETDAGLAGTLEYATDLFDATTVRRWLGQLRTLLAAAAASPDEPAARLPLLGAGAAHQLLVEWNRPVDDVAALGLHQLFERQAAASPDACALICGVERLSYRALDERAGRLAAALRQRGVGPDVLVGISMERSASLLTAVLGVLKAGGAYLPLDPAFPADRLAMIREDSGVRLVLTEEKLSEVSSRISLREIRDPHPNPSPKGRGAQNSCSPLPPGEGLGVRDPVSAGDRVGMGTHVNSLAYVLYTSGTTGRPKGVAVTHENAVNFLESMREAPGLVAGERLLAVTTLSFDIHVLELFLPLTVGATVVLATSEEAADGRRLRDLLQEVDVLQATPATWRMLIEAGWEPGETPDLRMLSGGEALPRELAERMLQRGRELWNLYGPTETTVWSAVCRLRRGGVHVGRPIARTSVHVVDRGGRPVPAGALGELRIGGGGVTRGYLGRPALTAEKFVPDALGRLYRTGDLGRRRADGTLEVLGRLDHQVKVRGFRIELGEVETRLLEQPSVARAAALARRDGGEEAQLIAYVVPSGGEIDAGALREALAAKLPPYMVPSVFVELPELPLTPNGKIDRKALPAPSAQLRAAGETVPPRDALELSLVRLWEEVLGVERVGVTDDFFVLGGHSLAAVRLMARVEQEVGHPLPLSALFQGATVERLARRLREDAPPAEGCLVTLRSARGTEAQGTAVFCVHPAGGNALAYQGLARALGDGPPVYAFQSRGLEDGAEPLERVEDMADFYAGKLPEVAPEGSVALLGWSFGGLVAYEMGRRLREAGREVTIVALLDTAVPAAGAAPELPADDGVWLADIAAFLAAMEGREPPVTSDELCALEPAEQRRRFLTVLSEAGFLPPGVSEEQVRRLLRVYRANVRAAALYVPRPYDGHVAVLRAALGSVHRPEVAADSALGWRNLVRGRLDVGTVPGEHLTLLARDHVEGLAERLRPWLSGRGGRSGDAPRPAAEAAVERDLHLTPR